MAECYFLDNLVPFRVIVDGIFMELWGEKLLIAEEPLEISVMPQLSGYLNQALAHEYYHQKESVCV